MLAVRQKRRLLVLACAVIAVAALAIAVAGCGSDKRGELRMRSSEIAQAAVDAAAMVDLCVDDRLTPSAARGQAESLARRFREVLRKTVAFANEHGERDLAGSIAVLALDGQQQVLLVAGDPANDRLMRLRGDRLQAIASNARALAISN